MTPCEGTPRRVLILMSHTGGGHWSAAKALIDAMARLQSDVETATVDFITTCLPFPLNLVGSLYGPLVNRAPWLWKAFWILTNARWRSRPGLWVLSRLGRQRLIWMLKHQRPDVVVSVHPLANDIAADALEAYDSGVPLITVVTDLLDAHVTWFHPDVALCTIPTEEAQAIAFEQGLTSRQVEVVGLPVHLDFRGVQTKQSELRERLQIEDRTTVLAVGGGEGVGRLHRVATALDDSGLDLQLLVVCGRNERLQQRLQGRQWRIPSRIYGFVENMPQLMGAADVIVTKAGPGTISEALVAGLPIVLYGYIPGQEEGNVRYVLEGGAGFLAERPENVVALLEDLLAPDEEPLARFSNNARRLARPESALEIAEMILGLART